MRLRPLSERVMRCEQCSRYNGKDLELAKYARQRFAQHFVADLKSNAMFFNIRGSEPKQRTSERRVRNRRVGGSAHSISCASSLQYICTNKRILETKMYLFRLRPLTTLAPISNLKRGKGHLFIHRFLRMALELLFCIQSKRPIWPLSIGNELVLGRSVIS